MDKNRPFGIHTVHDFTSGGMMAKTDMGWRFALCLPYPGRRILKAWWVLTGRAEAVIWPKSGELEAALNFPQSKADVINTKEAGDH